MKVCCLCEATSAGTQVTFGNNRSKVCGWCRGELAKRAHGFCPRCEKVHALDAMTGGYCRPCKRAQNKEYYARHAEQERARVRARLPLRTKRHRTPEQRRAYYAKHKAHMLEKQRARYAAKAERYRAEAKAYRQRKIAENPNFWRERTQRQRVRAFRRIFGR